MLMTLSFPIPRSPARRLPILLSVPLLAPSPPLVLGDIRRSGFPSIIYVSPSRARSKERSAVQVVMSSVLWKLAVPKARGERERNEYTLSSGFPKNLLTRCVKHIYMGTRMMAIHTVFHTSKTPFWVHSPAQPSTGHTISPLSRSSSPEFRSYRL